MGRGSVSPAASHSVSVCLWSQVEAAARTIQKAKVKAEFLKTSSSLVEMLRADRYNGSYFCRAEEEPDRLCTQEGWFTCQV